MREKYFSGYFITESERRQEHMKQNEGVISLAAMNEPVPGCTVSGAMMNGVTVFSMAEGTDISAESYPADVLHLQLSGRSTITHGVRSEKEEPIGEGEAVVKQAHRDNGVKAQTDSVYLEIALKKEDFMNGIINAGEVFRLKDLVPYQDGKIVNMDIVSGNTMKFVVMAFDGGTGLSEHAAPGDAIVFALEGRAVIGYQGKEYPIEAGQQFRFAKGGLHSVKADGRFKMALLLILDE